MKTKHLIIISVLIILSVLFFYFFNNKNYVLKINDQKISKQEFLIYLYEQKKIFEEIGGKDIWLTDFDSTPAKDVAKQNALNSIILVKTVVNKANSLGLTLTKADLFSINKTSEDLYNELLINCPSLKPTLKLIKKITTEITLEQKLFEYLTNSFQLSEIDFNIYLNNYINQNKKDFFKITTSFAYIPKNVKNSYNIINKAREKIKKNNNFKSLSQISSFINIKTDVLVNKENLDSKVLDLIFSSKVNEISPILNIDNYYYFFKIIKIEQSFDDNFKDNLKKQYIETKKNEIYLNQINSFSKNTLVIKNEDIWGRISIDDLINY